MSDELQQPEQQNEPSVLDYVKSLFRFGRGERIQLPDGDQQLTVGSQPEEPQSFEQTQDKPETFQLANLQSNGPVTRLRGAYPHLLYSIAA